MAFVFVLDPGLCLESAVYERDRDALRCRYATFMGPRHFVVDRLSSDDTACDPIIVHVPRSYVRLP
jgi:hypothetical protein